MSNWDEGDWEEIKYPITLDYRKSWGDWEAVREIIQNAMDLDADFNLQETDNGLVVRDYGKGMEVRHFLLGVSEKEDEDSRGQFGEGLKIAFIVLKRNGYDVKIKSDGLAAKIETDQIEDEECLKVLYKKTEDEIQGTKLIVEGYDGETYEDRFLTGVDDSRDLVYEDISERQIIDEDDKSALYIKDIFIQELDDAYFSYNLKEIELTESRNIADMYEVKKGVAAVLSKINNIELIKEVMDVFEIEDTLESDVSLQDFRMATKSWKKAFKEKYGEDAVLKTSDKMETQAEYEKARVVDLPPVPDNILPTDKEYLKKKAEEKVEKVKLKELSDEENKALRSLKRRAKKVGDYKVIPVRYPERIDVKGRAVDGEKIEIKRKLLRDKEKATRTLIHELGHLHNNSGDMTKEHLNAMEEVATKLVVG